MAFKVQPSFAAGELDPAMHELTTLQKYKTGLARLRGFCIGKTGRIISLPGTTFDIERKYPDHKVIVYYPEFSKYEVEFGAEYLRIHNLEDDTYVEVAHGIVEADLERVHFAYSGRYLYFACSGYFGFFRLVLGDLDPGDPDLDVRLFNSPMGAPGGLSGFDFTITPTGTPAGYDVEYVATYMTEDEESYMSYGIPVQGKLPVANNQYNTIDVIVTKPTSQIKKVREVRIYRRAKDGTDYGYIGSTDTIKTTGVMGTDTARTYTFRDIGGGADYTNTPPSEQEDFLADTTNYAMGNRQYTPDTIYVYQQRLILPGSLEKNKEVTFASRPGHHKNFLRDFPLSATSALAMKSGTSGTSQILRYLDMGGLAAFTTRGLYVTANGPLVPETASMNRRGNWVIDEKVEPLIVPGGFLFVEKSTGAVVQLNYSNELDGFSGGEITIYSDHLFRGKRVKSWAYQSGIVPLIWVVMDDGTCNILTYVPEQQMTAWSWVDTDGKYETVGVRKKLDGTHDVYFTVLRNGKRVREKLSDRFNIDFKEYNGAHGSVIIKHELSAQIEPVVPGEWDAEFYLSSIVPIFSNVAGQGAVGSIFRYFDEVTGVPIDFQVTQFIDGGQVRATTVDEMTYPSTQAGFGNYRTFYRTYTTVTGLSHLEGKEVYVRLDGFTEASPLELDEYGEKLYNTYVVTGGQITLQDGKRGAVIIVGLPQVQDFQLLDVDTVEQQPATLASVNLVKAYLKYFNSRGVYVADEFPEDDTTIGMIDSERQEGDDQTVLFNGVPQKPYTKRVEIKGAGSWKSHGKMCARNVSCNPVEILSIISDLEVDRR